MTTPFPEKSNLAKFVLLLLAGFLFFGALYYGSVFFIPVGYAAVLAMLMLPVARTIEKWGANRAFSTIICLFIIIIVFAGFIFLFSTQLIGFTQDLPDLKEGLDKQLQELQLYIQSQTDISPERQISYFRSQSSSFFNTAGQYLSNILMATTDTIAKMGLVIIYIFFFLYYRAKFKTFILKIVDDKNCDQAKEIIKNTSIVTQQYLGGKLIVTVILAVFNSAGLMIIGLENAIFWGVFGAVLNIIPYIGTFLAGLFPVLVALITYDSLGVPIAVASIFVGGQFIENNFLTPFIIGSKVDLNPLFTIMSIIIGGILWGVSGLILFIPFLGITKVIFDNVPKLEPYGYLIGDEKSEGPSFGEKLKEKMKNIFKRH